MIHVFIFFRLIRQIGEWEHDFVLRKKEDKQLPVNATNKTSQERKKKKQPSRKKDKQQSRKKTNNSTEKIKKQQPRK